MLELASKSAFSLEGYFARPRYRREDVSLALKGCVRLGSLTLSEEWMRQWDGGKSGAGGEEGMEMWIAM